MGCYIKKYEELRKELKLNDQLAIVKRGISSVYPINQCDQYDKLLDSLNLEVTLAAYVDEFNELYAHIETPWSRGVIDRMNWPTLKPSSIDPPKKFDLLQEAHQPQTIGGYYIVLDEDVEKFDLCRSRVSTPVTNELGLAFVCKYHFDAKFNAATKWEWGNAKIFIDGKPLQDLLPIHFKPESDKRPALQPLFSNVDLSIHTEAIHKALENLAKSAKKTSEKIAMDTKAYGYCVTDLDSLRFPWSQYTCSGTLSMPSYGTVQSTGKVVDGQNVDKSKTNDKLKGTWVLGASDLEEVTNEVFKETKLFKRLNDIRSSYIGKPDTGLNRIAMEFEIREIFDEIEHTTGDANSITAELCECESCPPVIVNIGAININSKEELDTEWGESVREKFAKQFRESCEKVFREDGIL